jgi:hypothetical protein
MGLFGKKKLSYICESCQAEIKENPKHGFLAFNTKNNKPFFIYYHNSTSCSNLDVIIKNLGEDAIISSLFSSYDHDHKKDKIPSEIGIEIQKNSKNGISTYVRFDRKKNKLLIYFPYEEYDEKVLLFSANYQSDSWIAVMRFLPNGTNEIIDSDGNVHPK